jgi:hypothetical protein
MKMLRAIHQEIAQKKAALSGNDLWEFELAIKGLAAWRLLCPRFTLNLRVGARWEVKTETKL